MGKMQTALLVVFAIELAMAFFVVPIGEGSNPTSFMDFLVNPTTWSGNAWFSGTLTAITAIGVGAIVIGSFITGRDWIFRATLVAVFLTFGAVIFQLWAFINAHLAYINVEAARELVTTVLVSPLLVYFIFAGLDFISGKD